MNDFLTYIIKFLYSLFFMLFLVTGVMFAQKVEIKGNVLEKDTEQPLSGAHVYWLNRNKGTTTKKDGSFILTGKPAEKYRLKITFVGYKTRYISLLKNQSLSGIKIYMKPAQMNLKPVTVLVRRAEESPQAEKEVYSTVNPSHDAGEFLDQITGIAGIRKGGGFGVDPVIRGFQKQQVQVQVDGILQSQGACPNRMDPPTAHVQIENISSVEVLKGPYALKYGPSFGGIINFKSKEANYEAQTVYTGYGKLGFESNIGRQRYSGGITRSGKNWITRLHLSRTTTEDYEDGKGMEVQGEFGNWEYTVDTEVSISEKSRIAAQFSQGYTQDTEYPALMMDMREDKTSNLRLTYSGNSIISNHSKVEASVFSSWVDHLMDNHERKMSSMMKAETDVQTKTQGYDIKIKLPVDYGQWSMGTDATLKSMEGYRYRTMQKGPKSGMTMVDNVWQGGLRNRWGGFAELQPFVTNWNMVFSARMDYYYSNATEPATDFAEHISDLNQRQLNWSVSAGFQRELGPRWTLGLWLGRASRYPGMKELFINYLPVGMDPYEYIGNPGLESEVNYQTDVIVGFNTPSFNVKTTMFYSRIADYITAEIRPDLEPKKSGTPGVKQYINVDQAALYGFEASVTSSSDQAFGYEVTASWTRGRNVTRHEDLPQIPPLEGNLKLKYRLLNNTFIPAVHFRAVADQEHVSERFGESATEGFFLTHVRASYSLNESITLSAGVNNMFDVTYHEHLNRSIQGSPLPLNDPGRSFFFEIKWDGRLL